jgi:hypothetical protein
VVDDACRERGAIGDEGKGSSESELLRERSRCNVSAWRKKKKKKKKSGKKKKKKTNVLKTNPFWSSLMAEDKSSVDDVMLCFFVATRPLMRGISTAQ